MSNILTVSENVTFLKLHNKKIPNTIHGIKKKAMKLITKKMCVSNCDVNKSYKHFLSMLHRKKMISPNNKNIHCNTSKLCMNNKKCFNLKQTRNVLMIYHL